MLLYILIYLDLVFWLLVVMFYGIYNGKDYCCLGSVLVFCGMIGLICWFDCNVVSVVEFYWLLFEYNWVDCDSDLWIENLVISDV